MSARSRPALLALLAVTVLAVTIAPLPAAIGDASAQTTPTPTDEFPAESTTITVELQPDGDARWTITTRFATTDETEREAFRQLATRYENDQVETPWVDELRASKDAAAASTGRSMNVTDVRRSSNLDNSSLTLQLTWTDFARQDGTRFVADDVFNTTHGTWLDGLTAHQKLQIELPPGATLQHAPQGAAIQQGRIQWDGPQRFDPGYMRIAYTVDEDATRTTTERGSGDGLLLGGFFVLGIGAVAVGVYVLSRRHGGVPGGTTTGDGTGSPPAGGSSGVNGGGSGRSATTGTVEPTPPEPDHDIDEELLSDEERVERLLAQNGGRMKQASIVKETGWSNAKVSQLLSAMDEDGRIDKLRIGRENLISFPDEGVTEIDEE